MPNTQEIMGRMKPALGALEFEARFQWRPNILWAVIIAAIFVWSVYGFSKYSEFIYFQF